MAIAPHVPAPFAVPAANPAISSQGQALPYISSSEYVNWPTGMDVENLTIGSSDDSEASQSQTLADLIQTASVAADQFCFGADAAAKGASLAASLSVETDQVPILGGMMRLICDYKPIVSVQGVDIGYSMNTLGSVGAQVAAQIRFGRRTIYVPLGGSLGGAFAGEAPARGYPQLGAGGPQVVVWSYVNGYAHTQLAAPVTAGASTCQVTATDGATGLLGVIPGQTRLRVVDGNASETVLVQAVSGTTVTTAAPFANSHVLPALPDFVPVTALPTTVRKAVVFLTTALIKTQGNAALVLSGTAEPIHPEKDPSGANADVYQAKCWLMPYRVRVKSGRH